jgi:streptomycin 6-kinase
VIEIPTALLAERTRQMGDEGRRWVQELPQLVDRLCADWDIELDGRSIRHGANAVVIDAHHDRSPCVLKVSWHLPTTRQECIALRTWDGRGAVQLIDARLDDGALLLERLNSDRTLRDLPLDDAAGIAGTMIRRLTVPAPRGLPLVGDYAASIADTLDDRNRALGAPVAAAWVDLATELERDLAASAGTSLVHADLHYGNILAASREPWLAIDPHAVAGDPELSVPELMWTRIDEIARPEDTRALLATIVEAGDLDAERAWAWTVVRAVDYWLWGLNIGLTEDPVRCHRLLDELT